MQYNIYQYNKKKKNEKISGKLSTQHLILLNNIYYVFQFSENNFVYCENLVEKICLEYCAEIFSDVVLFSSVQ